MLTDTQLADVFDAELRVPPISSLIALEHVLREVQLFSDERELMSTLSQLRAAGFDTDDMGGGKLQIGIKKLLSMIEMARQEPDSVGERLASALLGLGM